eukprot:CAMPEP_0170594680 /NCGR_PEP_ID=MMETSP0224-20130122/14134_1 /TAXON_ID=285029 /ORGANISM="Togula jolla, Strain CCCM 725" /LENGTH=317 /DNA_ID=CAMNT_0010918763 /DNA_START=88 /DNA_END=1041 /DNA_ORIENTATION=+
MVFVVLPSFGAFLIDLQSEKIDASSDSMVKGRSNGIAEPEGPAEQPPLMILQRGCTGSSEIIRMARQMLPLLGVDLYPLSVKELVRASKNPWYQEGDDMGTAMERGVSEAKRQRQALLFNNFHLKDNEQYKKMNDFLVQAQTRSVIVHRNNSLDTLVCDVRDCFADPAGVERGYTVDTQGQKIDLCFDRRSSSIETLAHLDPKHVVHHLKRAASFPEAQATMLKNLGYLPAKTVLVEDLFAFEYSKSSLGKSVNAWESFFESLGVEADSEIIRSYLAKAVASRSRPRPHSQVIHNYKVIHQTLTARAKELCWMLRRD